MRKLTACLLLLAAFVCAHVAAEASPGSATIQRRRIRIVRTSERARQFPELRRATISYPFVSGIADRTVLKKVRALLEVRNVFETSIAEYRENAWLIEFDYRVNYNKNGILDISFWQEGEGAYPVTQHRHFAISLKTGEVIRAADAFTPDSLPRLAEMANAKLHAEVAELKVALAEDKQLDAGGRDSVAESLEALTFGVENLDEFQVSDRGVTFLYDAGFPHVIQALQPDGEYFFSHAQLSPFVRRGGPLGVFVK